MRYIYYLTFVVKLLVLLYYHELQPNAMAKSIKFEALTVVDNKKQFYTVQEVIGSIYVGGTP